MNTAKRSDTSFTTSFKVDSTPRRVFDAINEVAAWWTGAIEGASDQVGREFKYRYKNVHHSTQKVTELVPGKKVVWHVTDAKLNSFKNPDEWNGTDIEFAISNAGDQTEVRFTHHGLLPACQCYSDCSKAWTFLVNDSLKSFITSAKQPEIAS